MIKLPPVLRKPTVLRGGLDLVTPTYSLPDGYVTYAINFECAVTGGYARVKGYERYDGRPAPSAGVYSLVQINGFSTTPTVGTSVKQATSLATGVVAYVGANFLILTKVTGTFDQTNDVKNTALTVLYGTAVTIDVVITSKQSAQFLNATADIYRADIEKVGGANGFGACLGEFEYNDVIYAFRALAADHSKAGMWKSTSAGWTQITLPKEVTFDTAVGTGTGGAVAPAEGATMTGGTSGKSATVRRVMLATGAWKTGATTDDAGRFIYTNIAGPANWTVGETVTMTGGATVIVRDAGADVTIKTVETAGGFIIGDNYTIYSVGTTDFTLIGASANTIGVTFKATGAGTGTGTATPVQRFECTQGNFFGQASSIRIYGADGLNRMFEFDGTYFIPITTGSTHDRPKHIAVHRDHLFGSIDSSVIASEVGEPYRWATGTEIPTGDTVSGLVVQPGSQATGAMAVACRGNIFMLYGVNSTTFTLVPYNVGAGAIDYSMQNAGNTFFFNQEGVTTLQTTINFGNFLASSLTARILPFINQERTHVAESSLMRQKNQYRVYFDDGYGLYVTLANGKPLGAMPVFFPDTVYSTWESELSTGEGVSFFGSTDGYVMQLEKGTSFDGASIDAMIILNWDNLKSPRMLKAFKQASIEMRAETYGEIQFSYQLGYGTLNIDASLAYSLASAAQGFSRWDGFSWDQFTWDGQSLAPVDVDLTGTGENIQVSVSSTTDYIDSFTLNSIIYHYLMRRAIR